MIELTFERAMVPDGSRQMFLAETRYAVPERSRAEDQTNANRTGGEASEFESSVSPSFSRRPSPAFGHHAKIVVPVGTAFPLEQTTRPASVRPFST